MNRNNCLLQHSVPAVLNMTATLNIAETLCCKKTINPVDKPRKIY